MNDLGTGFPKEKAEQRPSGRLDVEPAAASPDPVVELDKQRTIGGVIRAHADVRPERPAIVASQFALLSYRELQDQIDAVRAHLRQAGFGRDARIAVAIANSPEAALAIVAIACSAVAVPLDPKLTVAEVERCLLALRPSAVLALRGSDSAARRVAEQHGFPVIEAIVAQHGKFGLQLAAPRIGTALSLDDPDPEAPAFILHTSGTTADPNLVPFSHRNMLAVAKRLQAWFNLTPQDRCLNVSPVYYSHALTTTVLPPAARRRQRRVSRQCLERRSFGMAGRPATHMVLGRSHAAPLGSRKGSAATGRTHHAFAALHLVCRCAACRRCA